MLLASARWAIPGSTLEKVLHRIKQIWMTTAVLPYKERLLFVTDVRLSDRELEILRLTAEDLATKEIAARLKISPWTVQFHRESFKQRLRVQGTAGMVRYDIKHGW